MSAQNPQSLDQFLIQCQKRVEYSLETTLSRSIPSNKLKKAMRYACLDGGKRIRPVLVYASAQAVDASMNDADMAACAVELIHSYSLVHDDLPAMDDDDLRRGKPSVHKAFNEATAILVGDALQALAFQCLAEQNNALSAETKLLMTTMLAEAAGAFGMTAGQTLDLEASGTRVELNELETLHRLKTGSLIKASVRMGALCNPQCNEAQLYALEQYADNIGLAFQVQDDILDEIGDTDTLGKPQGSDRAQTKATYVSLLGLGNAKTKAAELANNAILAIEGISTSANSLRDLANYIVNRIH
ncbi:MAG: farnesyl diphosphate synthase [Pseudomonadota bacterium]|nr:farnesyl diphosphate synthase [Pseudomonadota bacterium]